MYSQLEKFVETETLRYYDEVAEEKLKEFKNDDFDVDSVVKHWEKLFKNETVEYCEPTGTTDEELFSMVYHKLVHSGALESILKKEQMYGVTATSLAHKRKKEIKELSEKQVFIYVKINKFDFWLWVVVVKII